MRVLLVNPVNNYVSSDYNESWVKFPLSLLYVAAGMAEHDVRILDLNIDNIDLVEVLRDFRPEQVGISCWMDNFLSTEKIIDTCKTNLPSAKIIAGGPFASVTPETYYGLGVDEVFKGAYCFPTTKELIVAYQKHFPVERMAKYLGGGSKFADHRVAMVAASYACPHHCAFCCPQYLGKYRARDLSELEAEISFLKEEYGLNTIYFTDASICIQRDQTKKICNITKKLNVSWYAEARVDELNEEIVQIMAESGCVELLIGVEGFDQEMLDSIGKKTTIDKNHAAIKMVSDEKRINLIAFILIGLPGQTQAQIEKMLTEVERLGIAVIPNMLFPIPGTPVWDIAQKMDKAPNVVELARKISGNYDKTNRAYPVINLTQVSDHDLTMAMKEIHRLNRNLTSNPQD